MICLPCIWLICCTPGTRTWHACTKTTTIYVPYTLHTVETKQNSVSDPDLGFFAFPNFKNRIRIRPFFALIYSKSTNENLYKSLIYFQCCGAGRRWDFLAGADLNLKFELEPEPISLGRLRLLFLASEKRNDLKIFIFLCIRYIFLYNKLYGTGTCWLYCTYS